MPENGEEQIITAGELGIDPEQLWQAADKLRGSIDAAEYKHVVLGLIFLKYISDAFEARRAKLAEELKADGIDGKQARNLSIRMRHFFCSLSSFCCGVSWYQTDGMQTASEKESGLTPRY